MTTLTAMPKYEIYKDSGVESLGEIPRLWSTHRFRYIFSFGKGLTITKENLHEAGVPCVNYGEVHSKFGFELDLSKHTLKCVNEKYLDSNPKSLLSVGDFVFADTSEDIEGSGNFTQLVSEGLVFAGYHTVVAKPIKGNNNRYIAYVLDSHSYRRQIWKAVKGVKVFSITKTMLKNTHMWLPHASEQTAIANFLDKKTTQIDEAISIKKNQIFLLKEHKQIIIQKTVTQGLNPNVPMKDSGVDWIGKIPAHWKVRRVKHLFRLVMEPSEKNNSHELLSVYTSIGVKPRRELEERGNKASTTDGYWLVRKGDIVVNKLLAWMGAIGISDYDGVTSPAYDILRSKVELNGYFYHLLFRSSFCSSELKRHSRGIMDMRLRLYFDRFGVVEVPYPPITEQNEIINQIHSKMAIINEGIDKLQQQIKNLKEYKTTLINSAVIGKIKVA
ncbi:MAG: restriction endonuclease subunit S [SAR86 cluster bacterium]|uniref:Restriction endonuclease subunit S n=1 Tax=SAR86 cluster bacterium TaxID=2030880 RepID=A0A2A4MIV7_9GAMM|nr:MAG: restriction endonuclease subunit S [SAR86 cluster bacterium]